MEKIRQNVAKYRSILILFRVPKRSIKSSHKQNILILWKILPRIRTGVHLLSASQEYLTNQKSFVTENKVQ